VKSYRKSDHLRNSLKRLKESFALSRKLLDQLINELVRKDLEIDSLREQSDFYRRQYEQELQKRRKLQSHPLAILTRLGKKRKRHSGVKESAKAYFFETSLARYSLADKKHFEFRGAFADALGRSPERVYLIRGADRVSCQPVSRGNEEKLFAFGGRLTLAEGLNEFQVVAKFPDQKEMELDRFRVIHIRDPELQSSGKEKDSENVFRRYSSANQKKSKLVKDAPPAFSLIIPCHNPAPGHLWKTIQSLQGQTYPPWEAIVVDDGSQNPDHLDFLETLALKDNRLRVCFLDSPRGISEAFTVGVNESIQDWLAFLDQDDWLDPDVLASLAEAIGQHPEADVIYSDEDRPGVGEERVEPELDSDEDPDLFLAQNDFTHLTLVRRELLGDDLQFQRELEGAHRVDFWQRVVERTAPDRIVRVPRNAKEGG